MKVFAALDRRWNVKNMLLLFFLAIVLSLSACARANVATTTTDPTTGEPRSCTASYMSVFKSTDKINMSACDAKGGATGSQSDQLAKAMTAALVRGLGVQ
jgi:curli biogenesis system outer membrane secretion channel CsgG